MKINRWVGTLQNPKIRELSEFEEFNEQMIKHANLFEMQRNNNGYLKTAWSLLYAEDLELSVDCEEDFGINDPNLTDEEFFRLWQPKALEAILEEILQEVGQDLCSVRVGNDCNELSCTVTNYYIIKIKCFLVPVDKNQIIIILSSLLVLREEWTLLDVAQSFMPIEERKKLRLKTPAWKTPATGGLSFAEKIKARKYTPFARCGDDINAEEEEAEEDDDGEDHHEEKKKKKFSSSAASPSTAASSSSASLSSSSGQIMMTACDGTAIKLEDGDDEDVVVKKVAEQQSAAVPAHTLPTKKPKRA